MSEEALQIAVKRRVAKKKKEEEEEEEKQKDKGEKERYTHLNAEFQ